MNDSDRLVMGGLSDDALQKLENNCKKVQWTDLVVILHCFGVY
jgi:hypothetical protein